jgi:hypothetical protein
LRRNRAQSTAPDFTSATALGLEAVLEEPDPDVTQYRRGERVRQPLQVALADRARIRECANHFTESSSTPTRRRGAALARIEMAPATSASASAMPNRPRIGTTAHG